MKIFVVFACLALAYTYADDAADKCREGYRACADKIKADGLKGLAAFKARMVCGKAYMKCKYDASGVKDKVECFKQCREGFATCIKDGGDKKDCMKQGYACVKAC